MAAKFDSLKNYCSQLAQHTIILSFDEIERILGEKLCDSAYLYPAYWSKNRTDTCVSAIIDGGYEIEKIDLQKKTILLTRKQRL